MTALRTTRLTALPPAHSLSFVADLVALFRCFARHSSEAQLVRDICKREQFGYLTAIHTASPAWQRLAQAPVFRDIEIGVKTRSGDRFKVTAAQLDEVLTDLKPLADLPLPEGGKGVREVFVCADYLDALRGAANMAGWIEETAADYLGSQPEVITLVRK